MWYLPVMNNILEELVRTSPVPVRFVSKVNLPGYAKGSVTIGAFLPKINGRVEAYIEILKRLSEDEKIATLLHELGHARCSRKLCKCRCVASSEGEIHADNYSLKWLLTNRCKKILKTEMKHIENKSDRVDYYGVAARCTMDSRLWQKCLRCMG